MMAELHWKGLDHMSATLPRHRGPPRLLAVADRRVDLVSRRALRQPGGRCAHDPSAVTQHSRQLLSGGDAVADPLAVASTNIVADHQRAHQLGVGRVKRRRALAPMAREAPASTSSLS
jgi:hypothetical protein